MSENTPKSRRTASRRRKDVRTESHIDGSANWTKLENPEPGMKYIWAYEGSADTGAQYYASLGYEEVICPDDPSRGVQPGGRRGGTPGQPYRDRGHVLMSIPEEDWQDIVQYGEDGKTGQAHADMIEQRIQRPRFEGRDHALLQNAHMYSRPLSGDD